jgi:xanthine dehydrogenase accessory factor
MDIYEHIIQIKREKKTAALCIVTETKGSTPCKAGAKMIVIKYNTPQYKIIGSIGGGAIEYKIIKYALKIISNKIAKLIKVGLSSELNMCCGGNMTIFIEPITPKNNCIILGAGNIGQTLCYLAAQTGFYCFVADPRTKFINSLNFPLAIKMFDNYLSYNINKMHIDQYTFIIITTHSHNTDQTLMEEILKHNFAYLALIGSKRKSFMTKKRCLNAGFPKSKINQIICPAGLNIKADTPQEIAISIIAQMICVKNSTYIRSNN